MSEQVDNRDTLVISGMVSIPRQIEIDGRTCQVHAWSKGHALSEKERLEDFIRQVSYGNIDDPQTAADELMDEMGWA